MKQHKNNLVRIVLLAASILFVQSAVSPLLAQERWVSEAYVKNGTIDTGTSGSKLAVRSGPGTSYGMVGSIANGEKVTVYDKKNGWVRISLPDVASTALKGFLVPEEPVKATPKPAPAGASNAVAQSAVEKKPAVDELWVDSKFVKEGAINTGGNTSATLAVRSGPSRTFAAMKNLRHGDLVTVYETRDGWVRISPDPKIEVAKTVKKSEKSAYLLSLAPLLVLLLRRK